MDNVAQALNALFTGANRNWGEYFLALSALGALTMALIQAIKDITPARRWFNQICMSRWLKAHAALSATKLTNPTVEAAAAGKELEILAADGDRRALYQLEVEKLCGQWSSALRIVLDYPQFYRDLFGCASALASKDDIETLLGTKSAVTAQDLKDARCRVANQLQRAVDAFQIATGSRWKWSLQAASFILNFLFCFAAMIDTNTSDLNTVTVTSAILSSAIVGFLAPVARDILAALQKLRE